MQVKDIELIFVAFDILYIEDSSVINRPLLERHALLRDALAPSPSEGVKVGKSLPQVSDESCCRLSSCRKSFNISRCCCQ